MESRREALLLLESPDGGPGWLEGVGGRDPGLSVGGGGGGGGGPG